MDLDLDMDLKFQIDEFGLGLGFNFIKWIWIWILDFVSYGFCIWTWIEKIVCIWIWTLDMDLEYFGLENGFVSAFVSFHQIPLLICTFYGIIISN